MNRFKTKLVKLVAIPAAALALTGWAPTAMAHDGRDRGSHRDTWSHDHGHRDHADGRRSHARKSRYTARRYYETPRHRVVERRVVRRPVVRRYYYQEPAYYYTPGVSFRWRIGW